MKWIREACDDEDQDPVVLEFFEYDAGSLQGVYDAARRFVEEQEEKDSKVDILMLNAGAIVDEAKGTGDGLEFLFAVNHLAHFALTMGLMPALRRAAEQGGDVRVVMTTSAGFSMHPDRDSLHVEDDEIYADSRHGKLWWMGAQPMYGRSKICSILFAQELSRRLRTAEWGGKVMVNACHPGKQLRS